MTGNEPHDAVTIHHADVVVPVLSAPIGRGAVMVRAGEIVAVGDRAQLPEVAGSVTEVHWSGVLMPGLVNAHAHLQYHGMAELGRAAHVDFERWSEAFDDRYDEISTTEDWASAALAGADQAMRHGTTTIADICTDLDAADALPRAGLSGISYLAVALATDPGTSWSRNGR